MNNSLKKINRKFDKANPGTKLLVGAGVLIGPWFLFSWPVASICTAATVYIRGKHSKNQ